MSKRQPNQLELLGNVHEGLDLPCVGDVSMVKDVYKYYHYICDGEDDRGWGCGYRTLQTLCSWAQLQKHKNQQEAPEVPSIAEIQNSLITMQDKNESFLGSRDWIGSVEVALCLDYFFDIPCKIVHISQGKELDQHIDTLKEHFHSKGTPIMMGGDTDASSKGILGVCQGSSQTYLLVLDPHYYGPQPTKKLLQDNGWIKWRSLDTFVDTSFYNMCLPQYKPQ